MGKHKGQKSTDKIFLVKVDGRKQAYKKAIIAPSKYMTEAKQNNTVIIRG